MSTTGGATSDVDPRLWPDGFLGALAEAGVPVPRELAEAYELLCLGLYFGLRETPEEGSGKRRNSQRSSPGFADDSLFPVKSAADRRLQEIARALRAWSATRSRS